MSEYKLPPGWTPEKLDAVRVHVINRMGSSNLWVEMNSSVFSALLCEAYEQGRREVEEAVGAGGVQPFARPDTTPQRHWARFIQHLNKTKPLENKEGHLSFIGSIAKYRDIFMEVNKP